MTDQHSDKQTDRGAFKYYIIRLGGVGVPTEYLVAPVLNWTGMGCDKILTSWINESSNVSLFVLDKLLFGFQSL